MRKSIIMAVGLVTAVVLAGDVQVQAQTELRVSLASGRFVWDLPPASPGISPATKHVIECGAVRVEVPMPETTLAISQAVPGPGVYECSIYAENDFARQVEPNVPFVPFRAGNPPAPVLRQRIEVQ
jgi:hypothetical protein